MNTASLELCRELYELSGWQDDLAMWFKFGEHLGNGETKWGIGRVGDHPAYDLGYLLRKLHELAGDFHLLSADHDGNWFISTTYPGYAYDGSGSSPEDAACKLAIELFKQGILKREDGDGN